MSIYWESLGIPPGIPFEGVIPVVGSNADGRLEVFILGPDPALWHIWQTTPNGGWSEWASLGIAPPGLGGAPGFGSQPVVANNADGRLVVLVLSSDYSAWFVEQTAPNGGWSGWAGGFSWSGFAHQPALGREADGRLAAFAVLDEEGPYPIVSLEQTAPNGSWDYANPIGDLGQVIDVLLVGSNADGRLEVFGVGTDGTVWHLWQLAPNGGWSGAVPFGSIYPDLERIAVGSNADGRLELFVAGGPSPPTEFRGVIWHTWQVAPNDGWSGWARFGDLGWPPLAGPPRWGWPAVGRDADGRLAVFAIGADGALWYVSQTPNGGWFGWSSLGGPPVGFEGPLGRSYWPPVVASNADGRLEVFAMGADRALWHTWQVAPNDGWI